MKEQNLIDRIEAGVFSLASIPTPQLIQMARETYSRRLKDMLGCEICYRPDARQGRANQNQNQEKE